MLRRLDQLPLDEVAITTPVSLTLPGDADEATWLAIGHALAQRDSTASWWWGDWWLADRPEWGDRASFFDDPTWNGPAYSTIRHCAATCRWFEIGRRRPELSFSHHAELARRIFPARKCDRLLDWCIAQPGPVSVRMLRDEIERRRNGRKQRADWNGDRATPKSALLSRGIYKAIERAIEYAGEAVVVGYLRGIIERHERNRANWHPPSSEAIEDARTRGIDLTELAADGSAACSGL